MKSLLSLCALLLSATLTFAATDVKKISPADAAKLVAEGHAVLIDIREPAEWAETGVAKPAALLPMSDFDGTKKLWTPFLEKNAGKEVILYCRSGRRADIVGAKLAAQGLHVANAGGFKDWAAAGLPVAKP